MGVRVNNTLCITRVSWPLTHRFNIIYRAAKHNSHADALSRQPVLTAPIEEPSEMQVALITSKDDDVTMCNYIA